MRDGDRKSGRWVNEDFVRGEIKKKKFSLNSIFKCLKKVNETRFLHSVSLSYIVIFAYHYAMQI